MTKTIQAALLGLLISTAVLAQPPMGPRTNGGTPPEPATRIANQVSRLTTLLDLTTDQATQVTGILTAEQSSLASLMSSSSSNASAMQTAIESNNIAAIDQLAATMGTASSQMIAIRSKARAAIYALLNSTQKTKLGTSADSATSPAHPAAGPDNGKTGNLFVPGAFG